MKNYYEKTYKDTAAIFFEKIKEKMLNDEKTFIITANPETFILGTKDLEFNKILTCPKSLIVADGIGVVFGAKILGYKIPSRIPGIDISKELLELANQYGKKLFLYGSKKSVIDLLTSKIKTEYPNINLVGAKDGYSKNKDEDFDEIIKLEPDIVLVALGMGLQEKLMYKHLDKFKKGIFVGVGGSFDVISGTKKRAPNIFILLNLEWLYRIIKEPSRIKRFCSYNIKFLFEIIDLKNVVNSLFLFAFLLILTGGFIKPFIKPNKINYYENRPSYYFEKPELKKILNNEFQDNIEATMADQIPLASTMKKGYNSFFNILKLKLNSGLYKDYDNYYVYNNLLKFKESIVYYNRTVQSNMSKLDAKIDNYNEYIKNYPKIDFYVYFIEKDTDINFYTGEKMMNYEYLKDNLNLDKNNINNFKINNYDEFNEYFYKTDHHWNYKGSYLGYKEVVKLLTKDEQVLKPIDEKCFDIKYNGSKALTTGLSEIEFEEFCAYKFELPNHITLVDNVEVEYGNEDDYFNNQHSTISYGSFYGNDDAIVNFNYNQKNKDNILIFGESYDNAIIKLVASHFNETYAVDLRNYKDVSFDFTSFIKENNIKKVLFIGNIDFFTMEEFNLKG